MSDPYALTAGDYRRAAALILANSRRDTEGTQRVLDEVVNTGTTTQLVGALLNWLEDLQPALRTEQGQEWLARGVAQLAGEEGVR